MRIEEIEVGRTYEGKRGKPRTVVALHKQSATGEFFDVEYSTPGVYGRTKRCWCYTFGDWAKSPATVSMAMLNAAPIIYAALQQLSEGVAKLLVKHGIDFSHCEELITAEAALAKARGEAQ